MPLWKILPVARADDPRWQDCVHWRVIVVDAETAIMAVLAAAEELGAPDRQIGNESPAGRTGIEDEKLYHVSLLEPDALPPEALEPTTQPKVLLAIPQEAIHVRRAIRKGEHLPGTEPGGRTVPPHTSRP